MGNLILLAIVGLTFAIINDRVIAKYDSVKAFKRYKILMFITLPIVIILPILTTLHIDLLFGLI